MTNGQKRTLSAKLPENVRPDRRPAKTQASLAGALFALMQQSDWDDIAVQDICAAADVARSSFYAHFDSKIELLDHMIKRSLAQSREARQQLAGPIGFLTWVVDHTTASRNMFHRVARGGGAQIVLTRFKAALRAELAEDIRRSGGRQPALQANFLLGGVFDALIDWSRTWKTSQLPGVKAGILDMAGQVLAGGRRADR